jgi:hypothetical protein
VTKPRLEALLDLPLIEASGDELREIARTFPDHWAYLNARIRDVMANELTPEGNAKYLDLLRRWPCSADYYRVPASAPTTDHLHAT